MDKDFVRAILEFETPRIVYANTPLMRIATHLWRSYYLSAGDSGEDVNGKFQVYALSPKGFDALDKIQH